MLSETSEQELRRLRIENRELREELAEWRRHGRASVDAGDDATRGVALRDWAALTGDEGRMLLALLDAAPRTLSKERLFQTRKSCAEDVEIKLVDVRICKIRQKLAVAGLRDSIRTAWGVGYFMPTTVQAVINREIERGLAA